MKRAASILSVTFLIWTMTAAARQMSVANGTASIHGSVSTSTGTPIPGAEVRARAEDGHDERLATTDQRGLYEFRNLLPAKWILTASKGGFTTAGPDPALAAGVRIADHQRATITITLPRGAALAGRVIDSAGEAIGGVPVAAIRVPNTGRRTQLTGAVSDTTDDTGAFRLFGLAAGEYVVQARVRVAGGPDAPPIERAVFHPGTADASLAEVIRVEAGAERSDLLVVTPRFVRGVSVRGQVLSGQGPAVGAMVHIYHRDTGGMPSWADSLVARTTDDGGFVANNVPPGAYVIEANVDGGEYAAVPLDIANTDVADIALHVLPPATVAATIVADGSADSSRQFRLNVEVARVDREAVYGPVMKTVSGRLPLTATVTGVRGHGAIRVSGLPEGWLVRAIEVAGRETRDGLFEFTAAGSTVPVRIVITDRGGEVAGTVSSQGVAHRGWVILFPEDETRRTPALVRGVQTDGDGRFRIAPLLDATYLAVALPAVEGAAWEDPEFLRRVQDRAVSFRLGVSERRRLDLRLEGR